MVAEAVEPECAPDKARGYYLARLCARTCDEHKATDITILDVEEMIHITSCFVIATGQTRKQLAGIADTLKQHMKKEGVARYGAEGIERGGWILLDYGDVIVQLFETEARNHYSLEAIWGDAPQVEW